MGGGLQVSHGREGQIPGELKEEGSLHETWREELQVNKGEEQLRKGDT